MLTIKILLLFLFLVWYVPNNDSISHRKNEENIRSFFSSILLVVKFNFPATNHLIYAHDKLWRKAFINRVYIGPWKNETYLNELRDDKDYKKNNLTFLTQFDNYEFDWNEGVLAQRALIEAIKYYPNYEGYFYKHDDLVVNLTHLIHNCNKENIWTPWLGGGKQHVQHWGKGRNQNGWWWDAHRVGLDAAKKLLWEYQDFKNILISCTGSTQDWYTGGRSYRVNNIDIIL